MFVVKENKSTELLRRKILCGLSLSICIIAAIISFINVLKGYYAIAALDAGLSFLCGYVVIQQRKKQFRPWHKYAIVYLYIIAILLVSMVGGLYSGLPYWILTFPTLLYLLFGRIHGKVGSALLLVISVFVLYQSSTIVNDVTVLSIIANFMLAYAIVWVISHIYEVSRENNEHALLDLALRDALTRVKNRLALHTCFDESYVNTPCTLALLDIDNFKQINDQYGHDMGDCVLIKFAQLISETVDKETIFRIGGEEFVILIPNNNVNNVINHIELLRQKVQETPFGDHNIVMNITVSIGVSISGGKEKLSQLLKEADDHLYAAKRSGKNKVIHLSPSCAVTA